MIYTNLTPRTERKTKDIPASVSVIGKEKIQGKPMLNLYDVLQGVLGVDITFKKSKLRHKVDN
jgi:outer membrane receptor for ferrienterochelin and colicin